MDRCCGRSRRCPRPNRRRNQPPLRPLRRHSRPAPPAGRAAERAGEVPHRPSHRHDRFQARCRAAKGAGGVHRRRRYADRRCRRRVFRIRRFRRSATRRHFRRKPQGDRRRAAAEPSRLPPARRRHHQLWLALYARQRLGQLKGPQIRAIEEGDRAVLFYSREDLRAGMVGQSIDGIIGYSPATATAIMRNLVLYSAVRIVRSPLSTHSPSIAGPAPRATPRLVGLPSPRSRRSGWFTHGLFPPAASHTGQPAPPITVCWPMASSTGM